MNSLILISHSKGEAFNQFFLVKHKRSLILQLLNSKNKSILQQPMETTYLDFLVRSWETRDRADAFHLIRDILVEYGLICDPFGADRDVYDVEIHYQKKGGEFWVVERQGEIVGTAAYYPIERGNNAVEIRKMYILPAARKQGLGKFLLQELEVKIIARGFDEIWIETASVLKEAVKMYENNGYLPTTGVETQRCDRVYKKVIKEGSSATDYVTNLTDVISIPVAPSGDVDC